MESDFVYSSVLSTSPACIFIGQFGYQLGKQLDDVIKHYSNYEWGEEVNVECDYF
jgi:hypothetical protein